jgi:ligand-binding sensor domain-containing protein/two-component sensor histidine kinase
MRLVSQSKSAAFILVWSLLISPFSSGSNYKVVRLPISDQLPQRSAERLHVDASGYLWIRTQAGYHRFDGYELETLHTFAGLGLRGRNYHVLARHLITKPYGAPWLVDIETGLMRYDILQRSFKPIEQLNEELFSTGRLITAAHHDSQKVLWLAFNDGAVIRIDTESSKIVTSFNLSKYVSHDDFVAGITEASDGLTWLLSKNGSLLQCNESGTQCASSYLPAQLKLDISNEPLWIRAGADDQLFIAAYSSGFFRYDTRNMSISRIRLNQEGQEEPIVGAASPITPLKQGGTWLATIEGLYKVSEVHEVSRLHLANSALSNTLVNDVLAIGNGEFLAGTIDGIYLIRESAFESISKDSGLRSTLMTSFGQQSDTNIFIGTFRGLDILNLTNNKIQRAEEILPGFSLVDPRVMAIYQQRSTTWLGLFNHGLYRYRAEDEKLHRVNNPSSQILAVSDILPISKDMIAIATQNSGIHLVNSSTDQVTSVSLTFGEREVGRTIFALELLQNGDLIAGTTGGVIRVRLDNSSTTAKVLDTTFYELGTDAYCVIQSESGDVWVGTHQKGLYRWQSSKHTNSPKFIPVQTSPALPSNTIYDLEEDDLGMLWMSSANGLVRLNTNSKQINIYDETDGLLDNEFNQGASFKDHLGRLYFGGYKGFNRFEPSKFVSTRRPSVVRLVDIAISNERVKYDPAYTHIHETVLDHNDRSIDFEFSTMDMSGSGRSQYRYKLEGFDEDWIESGNRNNATYTNLPSGDFVFRAIGANSDGVWNYEGISLPIKVLPAPWLTWWALSVYGAVIFALLTLMKRYYETRILKEEATKQAKLMSKTAMRAMDELQEQLNIEHRLVGNLRKHAGYTIDTIEELLALETEGLQDEQAHKAIERTRQRLHCLKALESAVYFHGETLKVIFRDAIDKIFAQVIEDTPPLECELVLANEATEEMISIDLAMPLVVLVHELILNSVLHAFEKSRGVECLLVKFSSPDRGQNWILELSDSGCGLPGSVDPNNPVTGGMTLVNRIVTNEGGKLSINREKGTSFRIDIPSGDSN